VILGVGVNVSQQRSALPEGATSLALTAARRVEREPLLAAILNDLGNAYERADREGIGWIVPAWRSRSSMFGRPLTFVRDGSTVEAVAEDLGPDGSLIVRTYQGARLALIAGEVERVRLA
jgi:biotin-(acetyl-CoA carboxylase) ligase